MTYCCSQCSFSSNFESALLMHQQLHHETGENKVTAKSIEQVKSKADTRCMSSESTLSFKFDKGLKGPNRAMSATRLFDKLRARIRRSKTLITQPNDVASPSFSDGAANDTFLDIVSECTSKALKVEPSVISAIDPLPEPLVKETETYSCHLCKFDADRITVLDRHLLNDHKIGLENLLKLVMAKTKDGLNEPSMPQSCNIRQAYYKHYHNIADDEFVVETTPKIKIMKHASTNTELKWGDIPNLKDNCQIITKELEKLIKHTPEKCDQEHFMEKMQTLNEYMCKFMDTSNTLKRTLTEFGSRNSIREHLSVDQPFFDLSLEERDSPHDWERTHSEKTERNRLRTDKKIAESLFF